MPRNHSSDLLLLEMVQASRMFLQYVKEYSDPVHDEPRYVRFRRAIANATGKAKSIKEDQKREALQASQQRQDRGTGA